MSASYSASSSAMHAAMSSSRRLIGRLGGSIGGAPLTPAAIRFGDLTQPGEGEQDIAAADGAYNVGGGQFSVSSGRIGVVVMPSVGTYDIDGVDVEVVANARTCSAAAEIAVLWMASLGYHPVDTKILLAPGTYDLTSHLSGLNNRLLNDWEWVSVDSDQRALFTTDATSQRGPYYASSNSEGFTFRRVRFNRNQDPVGIPWSVIAYDIFTVDSDVTNVELDDCEYFSNFTPAGEGGKITTKVVGVNLESGTSAIVKNCHFHHLCTGIRKSGYVEFENNKVEEIYADFIEPRAGMSGHAKNNELLGMIGDGTFFHGDMVQLQVPPHKPETGPYLFEGNVWAPGYVWERCGGQIQFTENKTAPEISVAGPTVLNDVLLYHGTRTIRFRTDLAGEDIYAVLPKASDYPKMTLVPYKVGSSHSVIFTLEDPTDTVEDGLVMTDNNQSLSFISDGVSHWRKMTPGYRGFCQQRNQSQTLGIYEQGLSVFSDDSAGSLVYTLPPGTSEYGGSLKKDSTSSNTSTLHLPAGQTAILRGQTITGPHNFVLTRCAETLSYDRAEGTSEWQLTEETTTAQGFFSNGPEDGWEGLTIRYNLLYPNSPNGIRPAGDNGLGLDRIRNSKFYNNTILRATPPDANGDGVISAADTWNEGSVGNIHTYNGVDTFRNALTGDIVEIDVELGAVIRQHQNQSFGWDDPEDLTVLSTYLAVNDPVNLRPRTKAEALQAALVKPGSPLIIDAGSHSYIGALGTTLENGPYNWVTGQPNVNTKTPQIVSVSPADGATDVFTDTTITIDFDELIAFGTGNISLREVGGAEIEAFDVTSSVQLAITNKGTRLVITPSSNLPVGTNICIRIASTALTGFFNNFVGITDDSLNFTTVASNPAVYVLDNFVEASDTALASHAPDTDLEAGGWSALYNGSIVVVRGGLGYAQWTANTGGGQPDLYGIDSGVTDYRIELDVFGGTINNRVCIPFRGIDGDNCYYLQFRIGDPAEGVILYSRIGGSLTNVSQITGTDGEGDPNYLLLSTDEFITVLVQGTTMELYFHGKLKMSVPIPSLTTGTIVGIGARNTPPQFKRFACEEIVA